MTCTFIDGPAQGTRLSLRTAPHFLRVVIDAHGDVDALDQPEDELADDETVYVYVLQAGTWGQVFVRPGGRYEHGTYRYLPLEQAGELATRADWVAWCEQHGNASAVAHGLDPWEGP